MAPVAVCDREIEGAVHAVADELVDGAWEELTVRDLRVITAVVAYERSRRRVR
jgi:hypothetical protein